MEPTAATELHDDPGAVRGAGPQEGGSTERGSGSKAEIKAETKTGLGAKNKEVAQWGTALSQKAGTQQGHAQQTPHRGAYSRARTTEPS